MVERVRETLSPDLLKPEYEDAGHPMAGHCYVASEALYHLLGGKASGLTPARIRHEGSMHWFLRLPGGFVLDPTADQFDTPVPYDDARGSGFLTRAPSRRTQRLLRRLSPDT